MTRIFAHNETLSTTENTSTVFTAGFNGRANFHGEGKQRRRLGR